MSLKIEEEVAAMARQLETDREIERTEDVLERARIQPGGVSGIAAWSSVLLVGIPAAILASLIILANSGIYVEPFRSWWTPQLDDLAAALVALGAVSVSLVLLATRRRR